ncbi:MAG: hypothetical protein HKP61_12885 [Dactylosporangium sp.]|nr:hypothetical protein [Dactylosporangium sp.]NNJ61811.1 hypothetical protein [Dactylosporangium sp.]
MTEFEDAIATALADRADGDVRMDTLLTGARERGVRYRQRRRVVRVWAASVTAVLLAAGVATGLRWGSGPGPDRTAPVADSPSPSPSPAATAFPATDPTAAKLTTPRQIGTKPFLFHLDLAEITGSTLGTITKMSRMSGLAGISEMPELADMSGVPELIDMHRTPSETLEAEFTEPGGATGHFQIELTALKMNLLHQSNGVDPRERMVDGRPVALSVADPTADHVDPVGLLRWQPASGMWAQIALDAAAPGDTATKVEERLIAIMRNVRFDAVDRCTTGFWLPQMPRNVTMVGCTQTIVPDAPVSTPVNSSVTLQAGIHRLSIGVAVSSDAPIASSGEMTFHGHSGTAEEHALAGTTRYLDIQARYGTEHVARLTGSIAYDVIDKDSLIAIVGNLELASWADPASWPSSPLR